MIYRQAILALLTLIAGGCSSAQETTAPQDAPAYDFRDREAFRRFAKEHHKDWPIPSEMGILVRPSGNVRYAHWAATGAKPRAGVVVFFQGRTEFIEKNIHAYTELLARNYDVWTLDWRGQGLSSRHIENSPDKGYIDDYNTYLSDADAFLAEKVKLDSQSSPKILLAHSMGGGIGALHLLQNPGKFDRAIFTSPLLGLPPDVDNWYVRLGNWLKTHTGFGRSCAEQQDCTWASEFPDNLDPCSLKDRGAAQSALRDAPNSERYSHDPVKLAEIDCWIRASRGGTGPTLGLAGPSSQWLRATLEATDALQQRKSLLATPLLIVGAGQESVVENEAQKNFCNGANGKCCWLEIAGAGHEILIEEKPLADMFWRLFDQFGRTASVQEVCRGPRTGGAAHP